MRPAELENVEALTRSLSAARLGPYIDACDGDRARALRLYAWNIEASAAFLGCHAVIEVAVRNALHDRLVERFEREDWWEAAPLHPSDLRIVADAVRHQERRRPGVWTTGHVVAELPASFWEGLLANRYHAALWMTALVRAVPGFRGRRSELKARMERLRMLRNRAAHHEPIHARDLMVDHRFSCELAGFVATDLRVWVESHSRLPDVVVGRRSTLDGVRAARF
jgi:hypothetical protein